MRHLAQLSDYRKVSRLAGVAMVILLLLIASLLIFQVQAECKCDNKLGSCYDCQCEGGSCEVLNTLTRNPFQCRREVLDAICDEVPVDDCQNISQIEGTGNFQCSCDGNDAGDLQCFCDDDCYMCDCSTRNSLCKQIQECTDGMGFPQCCRLLADISICEIVDGCPGQDAVVIAVTVSTLVVILIAIVSVTLICYWRYKFKLTREKLSHSLRDSAYCNVPQRNQNNDPLYSVLDGETSDYPQALVLPAISPHDTQPPQLPTSQRPYYAEIDSDYKETTTSVTSPIEYEKPVKISQRQQKPFNASHAQKNEVDDYEEPADALKVTPQAEKEKQDPHKTNASDDYQEPLDAIREEEEEKQDQQKHQNLII